MGVLDDRSRRAHADRRRLRVALAAALAVHLLLLAAPHPRFTPRPPAAGAPAQLLPLRDYRLAPPQPPPEPAAPEPQSPEPESPETTAATPGPPAVPTVELLFDESELSRLVPPRPVLLVPPTPGADLPGGEVVLELHLDAAGELVAVDIESGAEELLPVALAAAKGWRFLPATLDGNPIPVAIEVKVVFPPPAGSAG